jgi:hypothetical protein
VEFTTGAVVKERLSTELGRSDSAEKVCFLMRSFMSTNQVSVMQLFGAYFDFWCCAKGRSCDGLTRMNLFWHIIKRSKWFKRTNFIVTQFTTYFNERARNFTHKECENYFFPKDPHLTSEVDSYSALELVDFGGLLTICSLMVTEKQHEATRPFYKKKR